jgi:hypothetical protein
MASTKRTWLWVILGVAGTLGLIVVLLIGGAVYGFRTHVKTEVVGTAAADQEFNQTREKFKGQQPLVEFVGNDRGDDDAQVHRPEATAARVPINNIRVLIHDLNQGRLIHATVPGWLLRMMPEGRYNGFDGDELPIDHSDALHEQLDRHRITIEDLERHGHGLVLDGHNRNTRILIWSE